MSDLAQGFRWRTMEGDVLTLDQMTTKHIFNSMKMVFNHLAEAHGGQPIWFQQRYEDYEDMAEDEPEELARIVVLFLLEIERRGDLPEKYIWPYQRIKHQITRTIRGIPQTRRLLLTPPKEA